VTRFVDNKVIVLNRTGGPGLLSALNFDTWNARTITCNTSFGPGVDLHDYTGRHPDIRTDSQGRAIFRIPSNAFESGQSYLCFSRAGIEGPVRRPERATKQVFFGARDLDIAPATSGTKVNAGRIWCAAGTPIKASLSLQPRDGMRAEEVRFEIIGPSGLPLISGISEARVTTADKGWHLLRVATNASATGSADYELSVDYFGTRGL
jgi:alpha-amylase